MDLFSHTRTDLLVRAFLSLKTEEECKAFLEDLLTTREVLDLSQRLLVARLLEYKMYKYMSYELKDRQLDAGKNFFKKQTLPPEIRDYREPVDYEQLLGDVTLRRLHGIFREVVKKQEDRIDPIRSRYGKIEKDEINMDEKTLYIETYIREHGRLHFRELLQRQGSRMEVIVAFLVILELMKTGKIQIVQEHIFDDIIITYTAAA